jgi:hypothetical protein
MVIHSQDIGVIQPRVIQTTCVITGAGTI